MKRTIVLLATLAALGAQAQTTVKDPWVRGTVAGQKATGMFAQITSSRGRQAGVGVVAGGRRGGNPRDGDGRQRHEDARRAAASSCRPARPWT